MRSVIGPPWPSWSCQSYAARSRRFSPGPCSASRTTAGPCFARLRLHGRRPSAGRDAGRPRASTAAPPLRPRREKGVLTSEELTAGLAAARSRLDDLAPGSGHAGAGWAAHVTISAPSRNELIEATAQITEAAANSAVSSLDWLDTQQAAAQACTWPLARGMRPVPKPHGATVRALLAGSGSKEAL